MGNKITIDDVLNQVINGERDTSQKEKFDTLEQETIDKNVYYYLENLFKELIINITGDYEGKLFELMKQDRLESWCWETTEAAALFMPDDTIIYRGDLYFSKYKTYYHSFIKFNYENKYYVLIHVFN